MQIKVNETGVDYAFGDPSVDWFNKHGFKFVVRYLSLPFNNPKNFKAQEKTKFLDAGIGILLVWEQSADTPNQGFPRGEIDGRNAKSQALSFGYPTDIPILIAIDTDSYAGNIQAHQGYIKGFMNEAKPYECGIYGDSDILLAVGPTCRIGWLPNAKGWSPKASLALCESRGLIHVKQGRQQTIEGHLVDTNLVVKPFKAWSNQMPEPTPITPYDPAKGLEPVRVRIEGFKNVFLFANNTYTHLCGASNTKYDKAPLEVWDNHPQGTLSLVAKAGLTLSDLVPEDDT